MRVVIVGAGLAGLRTAEALRAAGCDVAVVEGGNRPGGRVRTVSDQFVGGQYSESGAEWVDSVHWRMLAQLERFGVERLGAGEQWTTIRRWLHHGGKLMSPDDMRVADPTVFEQMEAFDRIVDAAADGIVDPANPQLHPHSAALDAQSLADVAEQAQLGELATLFRRRDSQGEFAEEPQKVSLLFVAQQRAHQRDLAGGATVSAHRVAGGFSRVTDGMAAELGECISYGEHLLAVEQDADRVTIHTDQRRLLADQVVLACSLVPLRAVEFGGEMPTPLRRAIDELGYGTVTKTSVQWPQRAWPSGYATTSGRAQRIYEPTVDQAGEQGILMSYCGGDGGRAWSEMPEADRVALAADEMRGMHGLADTPLGGYSRAWNTLPRFGGSYAVYEPGQVTAHWQVLREPWGRVHLAGEHVATCTGYMEGALETGESVAARIVAAG